MIGLSSRSILGAKTQANREGFSSDLLVVLDRSERRGLRRTLTLELRRAIQDGPLKAGTRLPPSRTLARDLGVARSVIVEAYGQLVADGYLEARQGSGTRVRAVGRRRDHPAAVEPRPRAAVRFVGGLPDPALFPRRAWQRHHRPTPHAIPHPQLGYPRAPRSPGLRGAPSR